MDIPICYQYVYIYFSNLRIGTVHFMAPEILNGEGAAFSSDIFASACYIFHREVHDTGSKLTNRCTSAMKFISIKVEDIVQPLRECLLKCLSIVKVQIKIVFDLQQIKFNMYFMAF
jgi:serine/threonine protein kinase